MRSIREGDVVSVFYNDGRELVDVIVLHTPADVGDMWYFDVDGNIVAQNPTSSNLDFILKSRR